MIVEQKLQEMGIELPAMSAPKAMYIPVRQAGNLLFVSGQVPMVGDEMRFTGKVGDQRTLEEGMEAARVCTVNLLAALKAHLSDLDRVKCFVKVQAFVSSAVGFDKQHLVANAASQLLFDAFGEPGRHARTAVAVNQLPMDATVEIEAIVEV